MRVEMPRKRAVPEPEVRIESPGRSIIIKSGREPVRRPDAAGRRADPTA